jgi:hypothetical protein
MKKVFAIATAVLVFAAILAAIAGYGPSGLPAMLASGFFAAGLLMLARGDYGHKPRFRVRRPREIVAQTITAAAASRSAVACDWTYTTRTT